jgi:hypothetical protein
MPKKTTYYALVDEFSSLERPGGVLRRVEDDDGQEDEAFARSLKWEPTPLLYSAERGDLDIKFHEITEDEAGRIVARIRASVAEAPEGAP